VTLIDRLAGVLERRTSRRGMLIRSAVFASALAVDPIDYVLHPGTAYASVCRCGNPSCQCGSACCDGYTEFCCTMTGANVCPPGTFAGGWWRADGSTFCSGPRYYIDCHGECPTQTGPGFCAGSDGLDCGCASGDCNNRQVGCITFRYGQCHQEIATAGRIACRVVTCTPAYLLDNACTMTAMVDDNTAEHNAPCLQAPGAMARAYAAAAPAGGAGLWLAGRDGGVFAFGSVPYLGSMAGRRLNAPVVGMAATPRGHGYWLTGADGAIFAFGSAPYLGSVASIEAHGGAGTSGGLVASSGALPPVVGMAATPDGRGYWQVTSDGGIIGFGSAAFLGSMHGRLLQAPIVGMAATPDGRGYWLVGYDGGVFAFGTAAYYGSTGDKPLTAVIAGLVPTGTGRGYWLWAVDGSVHPFGDARWLGGYPSLPSARRVLPSDGIDAFHALVVHPGSGYTLWAVSPLGPPPTVEPYAFAGEPVTSA
jgi:hypothetical protein